MYKYILYIDNISLTYFIICYYRLKLPFDIDFDFLLYDSFVLGIAAASFCKERTKDTAKSPTRWEAHKKEEEYTKKYKKIGNFTF